MQVKNHQLSQERLSDATRRIDPHTWTKAIEKSLLEENSDQLRLDYEELAITWLSVLLKHRQANRSLRQAKDSYNEALRQLITVHDTIPDCSKEGWIKRHLKAAYVINYQESVEEKAHPRSKMPEKLEIPDWVAVRARRILIKIFETFAQNIPVKKGYQNWSYATASAVKPGPYRLSPVNGFRVRNLFAVELDPQDGLSINVQLYEQLQLTETLAKALREIQRKTVPSHTPGENYYEAAILDSLCGFGGPKAHLSGTTDVVELIRHRQSENLRDSVHYETRQLAVLEFRKEYEKLIALLATATAEATQFIGNAVGSATCTFSNDQNWNFWIVMNNCLVADFKLREYGEQFQPFVDPPRAYDSREDVSREFERLANAFRTGKSAVKL